MAKLYEELALPSTSSLAALEKSRDHALTLEKWERLLNAFDPEGYGTSLPVPAEPVCCATEDGGRSAMEARARAGVALHHPQDRWEGKTEHEGRRVTLDDEGKEVEHVVYRDGRLPEPPSKEEMDRKLHAEIIRLLLVDYARRPELLTMSRTALDERLEREAEEREAMEAAQVVRRKRGKTRNAHAER